MIDAIKPLQLLLATKCFSNRHMLRMLAADASCSGCSVDAAVAKVHAKLLIHCDSNGNSVGHKLLGRLSSRSGRSSRASRGGAADGGASVLPHPAAGGVPWRAIQRRDTQQQQQQQQYQMPRGAGVNLNPNELSQESVFLTANGQREEEEGGEDDDRLYVDADDFSDGEDELDVLDEFLVADEIEKRGGTGGDDPARQPGRADRGAQQRGLGRSNRQAQGQVLSATQLLRQQAKYNRIFTFK